MAFELRNGSKFFGELPTLLKYPRVGEISHFGQHRQVVTAKVRRFLPDVTILVEPADGDVVPQAGLGLVLPHASLDQSETDLVDGFCRHLSYLSLVTGIQTWFCSQCLDEVMVDLRQSNFRGPNAASPGELTLSWRAASRTVSMMRLLRRLRFDQQAVRSGWTESLQPA